VRGNPETFFVSCTGSNLVQKDCFKRPDCIRRSIKTIILPLEFKIMKLFFEKEIFRTILPIAVSKLLEYFNSEISLEMALTYSLIIIVGLFVSCVCHHFYAFNTTLYGMQIRTACMGLVYRKVLN